MLINSEIARFLIKESLQPYYGNLYDNTIDILNIRQENFKGNPTFYHLDNGNINPSFLMELIGNRLNINSNLIRVLRYKLETGKNWNFYDFTNNLQNSYNYNFNEALEFETNFVILIAKLRDKRINEIFN